MRAFCIIIVSLFLFSACHRQQLKQAELAQNQSNLVVDYPAGVMIRHKKPLTLRQNQNATFAQSILSPHQIPVLDTNINVMVFVKTNGDRVSIDIEHLAGEYDIILFNAISNPVPLRINDLQNAYEKIFSIKVLTNISFKTTTTEAPDLERKADTVIHRTISERIAELRKRDKRIIISPDDTATRKFVTRAIPGIQWVEQRVDTRRILKINFENDLITYSNTDRYFTNGVSFALQAAWLGRSRMQKLMIPYRHKAYVSYTLNMAQDMYTPTDTRIAPTLSHDRPYSSYLYFGLRKTTADRLRKFKMYSQIDAGYLGPYSPGSYMQTVVHKAFPTNDIPLGWETQLNTDVILNYTVQVQKALVYNKTFTLLAGLDCKAGTLYNTAGGGLQLQAGKADPVFGLGENEQWPETEYYFFAKANVSLVAYNALLQGGMFNHDNIFTLRDNQIQRVVGSAEAGFHFRIRKVGIELAQHYLSPEYKGGLWHKWGRISLAFGL